MPSSYNRSDGPPYSRVFPHPAIQHAFPPVSGSVDKQAAFTHPSPHSVQWPPGGSVQKSSSSLDGPSRLSTIYFVSHLKKESENLQLLTYSDPDCTTNCFESINSGKDCLTLRTPNAVFNKVLKHKRGFLNKYAYVVKLDNLSLVRRPKKWLKSSRFCKIYARPSIILQNPNANLIYSNILDCSLDEMQSLINIMKIPTILKLNLKLFLNKNFHITK